MEHQILWPCMLLSLLGLIHTGIDTTIYDAGEL